MNVTDVMDFGDMAVFDTSDPHTINVTNFGNMPINLTIYGFGNTSNTSGGDRAFICPAGSNISVDNERWTLHGDVQWNGMNNLTSGPRKIDNLTIQKQSTDENVWNTTYWKLYIPPNPFGACNGTIVFEAVAAA
jgi:hypothetical protein